MFRRIALQPEAKPLTPADLKSVEQFADRVFGYLGLDVAFTSHFIERLNDPRNRTQITVAELIRLFTEAVKKHGKTIDKLPDGAEAVLTDSQTFINLPFLIKYDQRQRQYVMLAKTVMRKPNFHTPSPRLTV